LIRLQQIEVAQAVDVLAPGDGGGPPVVSREVRGNDLHAGVVRAAAQATGPSIVAIN
jgi:hypothetical protein